MPHEPIAYYIERLAQGSITTDEWKILQTLLRQPEQSETLADILDRQLLALAEDPIEYPDVVERVQRSLNQEINKERQIPIPSVHRVHPLRTAWLRYAAAAMLILGAGAYLWNTQKEKPALTKTSPAPVHNDIAPGGNKAILTLADGRRILLDSASNGDLAREANTTITKTGEGEVVYHANKKVGSGVLLYNTMTTPRGGQYQLRLSDGTKVWLNAESSIRYPSAFGGTERKVVITGEAYFEVSRNPKQPFRVVVSETVVEVLGTHFNINAYPEESSINTTLLEGAVRITSDSKKAVYPLLTLKPGQQGQWNRRTENLSLVAHADFEQVMAWKKGLFNFNETDLPAAMRQIARWYDLEVQFEGVPDKEIRGKMGRDLNLSQVLKVLEKMEVKFRLDGRTLIVSP